MSDPHEQRRTHVISQFSKNQIQIQTDTRRGTTDRISLSGWKEQGFNCVYMQTAHQPLLYSIYIFKG